MARLDAFLQLAREQGCSDLHLAVGLPPMLRLHGELVPVKYRDLRDEELERLISEILADEQWATFTAGTDLDFSYTREDLGRFRVHLFRTINGLRATIRIVPAAIASLESLGLPPIVKRLTDYHQGLILVTGATGTGKSTTLAAMIDHFNSTRKFNIITLEAPIEYMYTSKKSLVVQREVGTHVGSFAEGLRAALREDPDVILVGELRDLETISLAVTAAETGILILSTLHTNGATATVDRIINAFSASEQPRIRAMLSTSLCGVISQQLVRRSDGQGRLAAMEILLNNPATANIIREGKTGQLAGVIERGGLLGMQSLDHALRSLLDARLITADEAYHHAVDKSAFEPLHVLEGSA